MTNSSIQTNHGNEITTGNRFKFGANWARFLTKLNEQCIEEAEHSLCEMLGVVDLTEKTFLDIGSGSGLFSLAARRLGAQVHSFDYDPQSVACTKKLKSMYFPDDTDWLVEEGSALNADYIKSLGEFDVVYSWGVLHHTEGMWSALANAAIPVCDGGQMFIAIYNEQGWISKYWALVKRFYNSSGLAKVLMVLFHIPYLMGLRLLIRLVTGRLKLERGMSYWYDMLDWLGGLPFEVATTDQIIQFYKERGFTVGRVISCGNRNGCNEFILNKNLQP